MIESRAFVTIDALRRSKSLAAVKEAFATGTKSLGISAFIICDSPADTRAGAREILTSGWNLEWLKKSYAELGHVRNTVNSNIDPHYWSESENFYKHRPDVQRVLNEARSEFQIHAGYSVPIHGLKSIAGLVLVAATEPDWSLSPTEESALHIISIYAYEAMRKLKRQKDDSGDGPKLSPREVECIKWISEGKTSWEIGSILGISEITVSDYIKSAARKMGTSTRAHLVARSYRLRVID